VWDVVRPVTLSNSLENIFLGNAYDEYLELGLQLSKQMIGENVDNKNNER
jgi:hypothetical protein